MLVVLTSNLEEDRGASFWKGLIKGWGGLVVGCGGFLNFPKSWYMYDIIGILLYTYLSDPWKTSKDLVSTEELHNLTHSAGLDLLDKVG